MAGECNAPLFICECIQLLDEAFFATKALAHGEIENINAYSHVTEAFEHLGHARDILKKENLDRLNNKTNVDV